MKPDKGSVVFDPFPEGTANLGVSYYDEREPPSWAGSLFWDNCRVVWGSRILGLSARF